jgi:hypothetical protein
MCRRLSKRASRVGPAFGGTAAGIARTTDTAEDELQEEGEEVATLAEEFAKEVHPHDDGGPVVEQRLACKHKER